jgi:hypothetical protein
MYAKLKPENTKKSEMANHNNGEIGLCIANSIIIPTHIAPTDNASGNTPNLAVFEAITPNKGS